ncbi:hypothetical protein TSAR_013477 [Trichomalopsis sarcophagae]|uniref:Uncharacterized protein n=1 Tax=Trichomalopsis sarcophagae TaxID=543379 RepID=A0A232EZM0_9HYME|nr:hypothetical protein TSAR_013477 [Trichomalopsis sarcophagae]
MSTCTLRWSPPKNSRDIIPAIKHLPHRLYDTCSRRRSRLGPPYTRYTQDSCTRLIPRSGIKSQMMMTMMKGAYLYEVGKKQDVGGGRPHGFPRESRDYRITTRRMLHSRPAQHCRPEQVHSLAVSASMSCGNTRYRSSGHSNLLFIKIIQYTLFRLALSSRLELGKSAAHLYDTQ